MRPITVSVAAALLVAVTAACSSSSTNAPAAASDDDALSGSSWLPLMDTCVQAAVGAAAIQAFDDNDLQHLESLSVDGDLAVEGPLTITVTTGNDEDGDTKRVVAIAQKVDTSTGSITCAVQTIDKKVPAKASATATKSALTAIVDKCTGTAIVAAQKLSDNYWHLEGVKLDGDPAQSGALEYTVTGGNDEDGDTVYTVKIAQTINENTGKATCKVTSSNAKH